MLAAKLLLCSLALGRHYAEATTDYSLFLGWYSAEVTLGNSLALGRDYAEAKLDYNDSSRTNIFSLKFLSIFFQPNCIASIFSEIE